MNAIVFGSYDFNFKIKKGFNENNESFMRNCICFIIKGRKQAEATGKRLAELNLPYSLIVRSTMARALETSKIIEKSLIDVPVEDDSMLMEGAPIPPEPPIGQWRSEKHVSEI